MFKIGADPELFFKKESKFISSIGLIGGSKAIPSPIGEGCFVQEDNVAVEFNIPACENLNDFQKSIAYALREINNKAKQYGLSLAHNTASALFDEDQLDCQAARIFGCDPDYNAWTNRINPKPKANNINLRSAGGHIHIGLPGMSHKEQRDLIKLMDLFIGVPSIVLDKDKQRRELYGKAGAFRPKTYGVEYRTPSNFWIWKKELVQFIYKQTEKAVAKFNIGWVINDEEGELIQECINTGNLNVYKQLNKSYKLDSFI